jgi:putative hemolysin
MPQPEADRGAAAREISYAHGVETMAGKALVRGVENLTGRLSLIRRADGYAREVDAGADFWEVMVRRYGLALDTPPGRGLENLPESGPLVVVANHPFGILDGLMMGHILSARRPEFRIIAHHVFRQAKDLERVIVPISYDPTREARRANIAARREALDHLAAGGAVGIFPGGAVSTARTPFGRPMDPPWGAFTARMAAHRGASVVPVFFEGENSRAFQVATHLHPTLRTALLIHEFRRRVDRPVGMVIGKPLAREDIAARQGDARALMDFLRESVYRLSPQPLDSLEYGYDFGGT